MSDWDNDDEDYIHFPEHVPGEKLDYFAWKYHMLSLGFSSKEFEIWLDECYEDRIKDEGLREMWKIIKKQQ